MKDLACDYIAYAFVPSRRCYLLPFTQVRRALADNGSAWWDKAKRGLDGFCIVRARNARYTTLSIAVPIPTLMVALGEAMTMTWPEV